MVNCRVLVSCFILASVPVQADVYADMVSYEAVYNLDLWENTPSSSLENVNGKTSYSLSKGCDGWHSTEKYATIFC